MGLFKGLMYYQTGIHKILVNMNERNKKKMIIHDIFFYNLNLVCFEKYVVQAKIRMVMMFDF
jgi:hypothetical protein